MLFDLLALFGLFGLWLSTTTSDPTTSPDIGSAPSPSGPPPR